MKVEDLVAKNLALSSETILANTKPLITPVYNVVGYGALGDGVTDDTAAIQSAIDAAYAVGGGIVFLPKGTYKITSTLYTKQYVSIQGAGFRNTILVWHTVAGGTMLDLTNINLSGTTFKGMQFTKNDSVTGYVTGIKGGSTTVNYNTAICRFEDLLFNNIREGIRGDAVVDGAGIFDSLFINCWFHGCFYGQWLHGSGNVNIHCRFMNNTGAGIVLDYLNTSSFAGLIDVGSIFVGNGYDIRIPNANGIRPCSFVGTWFEQSTNGIIQISNFNTRIMSMLFENCMLSSNATGNLMSFAGAEGTITLDTCTMFQTNATQSKNIVVPNSNGTLRIKNCMGYNYDGTTYKVPDKNIFSGAPPSYFGNDGDVAIDSLNNRAYFRVGDVWKYISGLT